jgi:hypothetical protein
MFTLFRTSSLKNVMKDFRGINGADGILPFSSLIWSNMVANTSANICGIPRSSTEKANCPLSSSLKRAMDVSSGPLLASTVYFVGFIIPKKSPFVENLPPSWLLRSSFVDFNKSSVEPSAPAARTTLFVLITLVTFALSSSDKTLVGEKSSVSMRSR